MIKIEFDTEQEQQVFLEELEYLEDFLIIRQIGREFQETIKLSTNKIANLLSLKKIIANKTKNYTKLDEFLHNN